MSLTHACVPGFSIIQIKALLERREMRDAHARTGKDGKYTTAHDSVITLIFIFYIA